MRDRIQRVLPKWPAGVDRYFLWKEDGSSAPLAFVQLLTPARNAHWDHLVDQVVRPRLEAVGGVGRVDVWGLRDETIKIWFDRDKLLALHPQGRLMVERCDVLQRSEVEQFAFAVKERFGGADVLINNAGQGRVSTFADTS